MPRISTWSSRRSWATTRLFPTTGGAHGTSGYDMLNRINGLFVDPAAAVEFTRRYQEWIGDNTPYREIVRQKKLLILDVAAGQRATRAGVPARADRASRPTVSRLHAECPAARSPRGHRVVPGLSLLHHRDDGQRAGPPAGRSGRPLGDAPQPGDQPRRSSASSATSCSTGWRLPRTFRMRSSHPADFAGKFQQVTAPVMAKGLEDTTFYVYNRLVSLNEVGGEPDPFRHDRRAASSLEPRPGEPSFPTPSPRSPPTIPSEARTSGPASTCCPRILDAWFAAVERWSELNSGHRVRIEDRQAPGPQRGVLLLPEPPGRLADRGA